MRDPMMDEELHKTWHLYFKEKAEWEEREHQFLNKIYALQEKIKYEIEDKE